jgi:hypothetical protein
MLKAFREALAKRLGEHVADSIWLGVIISGPIIAWLTSPTAYTIQLSRLQIAAVVFVFLSVLAWTAWITRRFMRPRRRFYLTAVGSQNVWGTTRVLPDGSVNTQINAQLAVENFTDEVLHLVALRLVKPRIRGEVLVAHLDIVGDGAIAARSTRQVATMLIVRGTPKRNYGVLDAVLSVADDEGHEQRVNVRPHGRPALAPTTSQ